MVQISAAEFSATAKLALESGIESADAPLSFGVTVVRLAEWADGKNLPSSWRRTDIHAWLTKMLQRAAVGKSG